jgi:hypothetical protein
MPLTHVEPDVFLEHSGVEVYHIYEDYGLGGPVSYWFTTDPSTSDDFFGHRNRGQFDARLLAARWSETPTVTQWDDWWQPRFTTEHDAIEALIESAIEEGRLP